ncbi:hypothetical protein F5Y03DRAFT_355285 [Xylaria venustula]|nr:hypothetical protein F5Y03DRAFT_355285 [Xylaria venustula]
MSFVREPLTKSDDFFKEGAKSTVAIAGSGQMVYWKQCIISVFKTGDEVTPIERITLCDGQALLKTGISVAFFRGKVKEEHSGSKEAGSKEVTVTMGPNNQIACPRCGCGITVKQ